MSITAERPTAVVFAPSPLVTVTVEEAGRGEDEVHFHVGGQGYWIARLLDELGLRVVLCASFGGEAGRVAQAVLEPHIQVVGIDSVAGNGVYVHDRRSGERVVVASEHAAPLTRHEIDDLYGAMLTASLTADVCVLGGGPHERPVLPAETYGRLARDLAECAPVVADLSGEPLEAVLEAGVSALKVSDEELLAARRTTDDGTAALVAAIADLASGADTVVVTRAAEPTLARIGDELVEVHSPGWQAVDPRGGGDSFTAGLAAGLARGGEVRDAVRLGAAAAVLNVTRHGLGSGRRPDIDRVAGRIDLRPLVTEGTCAR